MKLYHKIKNMIRKPIVDYRIWVGRYVPAPNSENAYYDMKKNWILVKGYYDKPFSFTTENINFEGVK